MESRMRRLWILFLLLLVCLIPLYFIIQDAKPNILLITLDTTRPDHLGCYGYERSTTPGIDQVAKQGVSLDPQFARLLFPFQ